MEFDARQAYKQAVAFWATGNYKYAQNTLKIIDAWATTNTVGGRPSMYLLVASKWLVQKHGCLQHDSSSVNQNYGSW